MKKLFALLLALTLILGASSALASGTTYITLGTGGTTGTYYALGAEIAAMWMQNIEGLDVTVQPTDASKDNIVYVNDGQIDVATVQNDSAYYAYEGQLYDGSDEVFDGFYAIGSLYPEAVQLMVAADSDITDVSQLAGLNVGVGAAGSGTIINAEQVLEAAGLTLESISPQYLGFSETATAFQDLQIEAGFITSGIPNASIIEAANARPVRILTLTDAQWDTLTTNYAFYAPATIPGGTYAGQDEDVTVPAITALLIVSKDADEELVYQLTKTLFECTDQIGHAKAAELNVAAAVEGVPVPFHPGAARYYAECGYEVEAGA